MSKKYYIIILAILLLGFTCINDLLHRHSEEKILYQSKKSARVLNYSSHSKKNSITDGDGTLKNNKTDQGNKQKNNSEKLTLYSSVPWHELDKKWIEELKAFILSVDYIKGEKMFSDFSKAKKAYNVKSESIMNSWRHLHNTGNKNKLLAKKLHKESELAIENYRKRVQKIFGKHYESIKQFYNEYEASIQAHAREPDYSLGLDIGFVD